jgi:hypothetical protein
MNNLCGVETGIYPGPVCFKPNDHHGLKQVAWIRLGKDDKIEFWRPK